ncbi:hypothetical protein MXB_4784, partial [Myxobolus squamalis]
SRGLKNYLNRIYQSLLEATNREFTGNAVRLPFRSSDYDKIQQARGSKNMRLTDIEALLHSETMNGMPFLRVIWFGDI